MSRASRRDETSVSLFPFLAVLLCAMGALIVLLIVLARSIRDEAIAAATPAPPPVVGVEPSPAPWTLPEAFRPEEALAGLPEDDAIRPYRPPPAPIVRVIEPTPRPVPVDPNDALRERLAEAEAATAAALATRDELAADANAAATRRDAARVRLSDAKATEKNLAASASAAGDELDRLRREAARLKSLIATTAREAAATAADRSSPKVEIIAHDGVGGTTRRPVLIECGPDGLRFLAEDVALGAVDLDGYTPEANPFAAGVDALVDHWRRIDGERPHVLLLVRPGGSVAYYAARRLLRERNDDVGYELLAASVDLLPPERDEAARRAVLEAIAAVPRSLPTAPVGGRPGRADEPLRVRTGRTGFEVADLFEDPTKSKTLGRRGPSAWFAPPEALAANGDARGVGRGGVGGEAGSPRGFAGGLNGSTGSAFDTPSGPTDARGGRPSGPKTTGDAGGFPGGPEAFAATSPGQPRSGGTAPGETRPSGTDRVGVDRVRPENPFGFEPVPFAGATPGSPRGGTAHQGTTAGQRSDRPPESRPIAGDAGRRTLDRPPGRRPPGTAEDGADGPPTRDLAEGSSRRRRDNPFASARPRDGAASLDATPAPPAGPTIAGVTGQGARTQWGPSGGASAIGLDRRVSVTVTEGRITVGEGPPRRLPEDTDSALALLLGEIKAEAANWPRPPTGFRWSPALETTADADGRRRLARLEPRLDEFGLRLIAPRPDRLTGRPTTGRR